MGRINKAEGGRRKLSLACAIWFLLVIAPSAMSATGEEGRWTTWQIGDVIVRTLHADGPLIWIGTSNGLIRFDRKKEEHRVFTTKDGLLSNVIVSIHSGRGKDRWVGTYGGGLVRFDGNRWEHFTPYGRGEKSFGPRWAAYGPARGLGDLWVYDLLFDRRGSMWVATWKGASRFDGEGFRTYTMDDGLVDKWVYTIEEDRDGTLWFGTEGGINSFDGRRWRGWTHRDGLGADIAFEKEEEAYPEAPSSAHHSEEGKPRRSNPNYVISSAIDGEGIKWFGTWGGGLARFDGKRFVNLTTSDGLAGNIVNSLAIDGKGIFWIGTNGGVSRYDSKSGSFKNFTTEDGLLSNYVYAVAVDSDGGKWFGTFGGVSRYTGG